MIVKISITTARRLEAHFRRNNPGKRYKRDEEDEEFSYMEMSRENMARLRQYHQDIDTAINMALNEAEKAEAKNSSGLPKPPPDPDPNNGAETMGMSDPGNDHD